MTTKVFDAFTRLDASDVNASLVNRPVGNAIINGAFEINQRGYASAANLASGAYGFDRWKSTFTNTTLTYTSAPAGQLVTINSGGSIEQVVERANLPAGTYTLSWQGTATGRVYNTGATPPSYAASPITVTLDGLANVEVEFTAADATKTLGYVQLESGPSAGPFRRNANSLQGELAACQRYYFRQGGLQAFQQMGFGFASSTSAVYINVPLPVELRIIPTSVEFGTLRLSDTQATGAVSALTLISGQSSTTRPTVNATYTGASATQYRPYLLEANNSTSGFLAFGAEM
jgi:hypothetical protein